jgi:hypothetical protein
MGDGLAQQRRSLCVNVSFELDCRLNGPVTSSGSCELMAGAIQEGKFARLSTSASASLLLSLLLWLMPHAFGRTLPVRCPFQAAMFLPYLSLALLCYCTGARGLPSCSAATTCRSRDLTYGLTGRTKVSSGHSGRLGIQSLLLVESEASTPL